MKRIALGTAAGAAVLLAGLTAFAGEEPAGQTLFVANKCQACHSVSSASIKVEGEDEAEKPEPGETAPPDLSDVGNKVKADFVKGYLMKKEALDGKKHRKKFAGTAEELGTLTDWLMTLKAEKPAH